MIESGDDIGRAWRRRQVWAERADYARRQARTRAARRAIMRGRDATAAELAEAGRLLAWLAAIVAGAVLFGWLVGLLAKAG
jgi:hypothetical protein